MIRRILILGTLLGLLLTVALIPGCDKLVTENNSITVIDTTLGAACLSCHSDGNDSVIVVPRDQWANSAHSSKKLLEAAVSIDDSVFFTSTCGPVCHSGNGFVDSIEYDKSPVNSQPSVINCFTCHLPHTGKYGTWALDTLRGQFSPLIMRNLRPYNYGQSTLCAVCHQAMNPPPTGTGDVTLTSGWGPHNSPQADIFAAKGGAQFGEIVDSGAHTVTVMKNGCVTCHFGTGQGYDYGEHTFRLQYDLPNDTTPYMANCNVAGCHLNSALTSFAFDSSAVIQKYLDSLRNQLEIFGALDSTGADPAKINVDSTISGLTAQILYNYLLVMKDGTHGLHNPRFVSNLLRESWLRVDSIPPQARFIALTDTAACAPITVSFKSSSRGKYTTFTWDFGDQTTNSTDTNPTHTYDTAGVFTVKLTVTGPGGSSTFSRPSGVLAGGVPAARIKLPSLRGCTPSFDIMLVDSTVGLVDSVRWTVNDTLTSSLRNYPIRVTTAGKYPLDIRLVVYNECGADTATRQDTAFLDTKPTALFTVSDTVSIPDSLYVTITNLTDSSVGIDSIVWYIDQNRLTKGWEPAPNPRLFTQGIWPLWMTAYNHCGSSVSDTITIRVKQGAPPREEPAIESRR